ncbi:hypothetical protein G9A89_008214 [Geosiphon pyriformis]|nr:hypothetical protein G9A89_008214 [Geosiphon pyriformis]
MGTCIRDNKKWPTATKYYCRPSNETTCHALHVVKSCLMKNSEMMCLTNEKHNAWKQALNKLDSYLHNHHKIWRMASAKAEDTTPEEIREIKNNPWMPEYNGPDYLIDNFITDDSDTFQN